MGDYDPARARALLDLYGYVDRDNDGWRDLPDGKPLTIEMASQPDDYARKFDELWKKNLNAIGVRINFKPAQWPENLKAARAGKLQFWQLGSSAAGSDGQGALSRLYGPQIGSQTWRVSSMPSSTRSISACAKFPTVRSAMPCS
jgi:ABC-type transport system substrate-binding protein